MQVEDAFMNLNTEGLQQTTGDIQEQERKIIPKNKNREPSYVL